MDEFYTGPFAGYTPPVQIVTPQPIAPPVYQQPTNYGGAYNQAGPISPADEQMMQAAPAGYAAATRGYIKTQPQDVPIYQFSPDGQPVPVNNTYGQISPPQYPPAVQNAPPDWTQTPQFQQDSQTLLNTAMQNAVSKATTSKNSGIKKGARIFGGAILPGLMAAFGGANGAAMAGGMSSTMMNGLRTAQMRDLQEQQNATDFLRAATSLVNTVGIKPIQQYAAEQNKMARFYGGQQGMNYRQQVGEQGKGQRQQNSLDFQGWKFKTNQERLNDKEAWNQQFKMFKQSVDMDQFERLYDQKERHMDDVKKLTKINQLIQLRGQDSGLEQKRLDLVYKIQKDVEDQEFDADKFNKEMAFKIGKAVESGDFPEGADPAKYLVQFQKGTMPDPTEIGMSAEQYNGLINEVMATPPRQAKAATPPQQGLQAVAGAMGQPMPKQPGQPAQQMQAAPAATAPQVAPQQVQQYIKSSGGDKSAAKMRLIQGAMKRKMSYQDASALADQILGK